MHHTPTSLATPPRRPAQSVPALWQQPQGHSGDQHRRNLDHDRRHRVRHRHLQGPHEAVHLPQQHDQLRDRMGRTHQPGTAKGSRRSRPSRQVLHALLPRPLRKAGRAHDAGNVPHSAARAGPQHQAAPPRFHRPIPLKSPRTTPTGRRHRGRSAAQGDEVSGRGRGADSVWAHPGPASDRTAPRQDDDSEHAVWAVRSDGDDGRLFGHVFGDFCARYGPAPVDDAPEGAQRQAQLGLCGAADGVQDVEFKKPLRRGRREAILRGEGPTTAHVTRHLRGEAPAAGTSLPGRLPRGVHGRDELQPGRRRLPAGHCAGIAVRWPVPEHLRPQGEAQGADDRVEGGPHPQNVGQLLQPAGHLPVSDVRVWREDSHAGRLLQGHVHGGTDPHSAVWLQEGRVGRQHGPHRQLAQLRDGPESGGAHCDAATGHSGSVDSHHGTSRGREPAGGQVPEFDRCGEGFVYV
uniref:(northern house mosquito) hypothetical protein n=1 Tax=Culex pipiens TaxID=7175 RepID=A0A8D8F2C0_CULPI